MNCEKYKPLLTGYLDDELPPGRRAELEAHLAACPACRAELGEIRQLKEELATMQFEEPGDAELQRYWRGVYNRLERGLGWILLSLGAILVLSYGAVQLIGELIADPGVALVMKIGVVALILGAVVLFVSLLRERLTLCKTDRYSKEIRR